MKFTGMEFPPRKRDSVCKGWWMSPRNCGVLVRVRGGRVGGDYERDKLGGVRNVSEELT